MADAVLGQIFDWIYGKLAGFFSEFFEMMNMMGAELFDLPWTQAVVLFFSRFAWVLYAVGLVVAGFEYAIQSQSGRGDLHGDVYKRQILSYHTQAAGCSDKARAKASGGRQPIEECGRTEL